VGAVLCTPWIEARHAGGTRSPRSTLVGAGTRLETESRAEVFAGIGAGGDTHTPHPRHRCPQTAGETKNPAIFDAIFRPLAWSDRRENRG
jgi:hypothetical protein